MRCEVCQRLILNSRYTKFTDARVHYLHKTCFDVFSNGRIKIKRKSTNDIRHSSKAKLRKSYESFNSYKYLQHESNN